MNAAVEAVVDGLAVARLTRLLQDDEVWPLLEVRELFVARTDGTRWADLATCPWCLSVWLGAGVVAARALFPRAWNPAARVLTMSQVAGLLSR